MVKIGIYVTARVECLYKTEKGDNLVESGYHLLLYNDRGEDLQAKLYIDPNDAKKYAIEHFRKAHWDSLFFIFIIFDKGPVGMGVLPPADRDFYSTA